jgi:2-polyprenyl-3-methyl-5-hydroxy-6-metoxy-1,4-benzoquinol methylase
MKNDEVYYTETENTWHKKNYVEYCNKKFDFLKKYLNGKIIDVCCGTGWFNKKYGIKKKIINTDFIKRNVPNFKKIRIEKMPFKTNEFDTVVCLDTLEHLDEKTHLLAIKELFRIGKTIIISTAFGSNFFRFFSNILRNRIGVLNSLVVGHYREYDDLEFQKIVNNYGKILDSKKISMPYTFMPLTNFLRKTNNFYTKIFIIKKKIK